MNRRCEAMTLICDFAYNNSDSIQCFMNFYETPQFHNSLIFSSNFDEPLTVLFV